MGDYSLTSFAALLGDMVLEMERHNRKALEKAAVIVETEAKRVIGTYDLNWPPLAPSTLAHKAADTPLLETGDLRNSIEHVANHEEAHIGSNSDKAVWHELGTVTIPPRSFLMGAAMEKEHEVVEAIGRTIHLALKGP